MPRKRTAEGGRVARQVAPETTLDFFVKARDGRKRDYIYDFSKSRKCAHPKLVALAIGGNWYRCTECNYAFDIVAAYQQPLHNLVIGGMLNALHFAKEFGGFALGEVLRRPIGQYDGSPHKPVLPEGMTFVDAVRALESIDVNAADGGKEQLLKLLGEVWASDKGKALPGKAGSKGQPRALKKGERDDSAPGREGA